MEPRSDKALEEYKGGRKEVKQEIRSAKRGHEISLASRGKENPNAFYTYIRSKRIAKERIGSLKHKGRHLCEEQEGVARLACTLHRIWMIVRHKEPQVLVFQKRQSVGLTQQVRQHIWRTWIGNVSGRDLQQKWSIKMES